MFAADTPGSRLSRDFFIFNITLCRHVINTLIINIPHAVSARVSKFAFLVIRAELKIPPRWDELSPHFPRPFSRGRRLIVTHWQILFLSLFFFLPRKSRDVKFRARKRRNTSASEVFTRCETFKHRARLVFSSFLFSLSLYAVSSIFFVYPKFLQRSHVRGHAAARVVPPFYRCRFLFSSLRPFFALKIPATSAKR